MTTVRDVAKLAGVSIATVSRVTNGVGTVSFETRNRVLTAVARLQYQPNESAADLSRNRRCPAERTTEQGGPRRVETSLLMNAAEGDILAPTSLEQLISVHRENLRLKRLIRRLVEDLDRWKKLVDS
jgi:hypothetical protein